MEIKMRGKRFRFATAALAIVLGGMGPALARGGASRQSDNSPPQPIGLNDA
jgi:hypothetical protein